MNFDEWMDERMAWLAQRLPENHKELMAWKLVRAQRNLMRGCGGFDKVEELETSLMGDK